MNDTAEEAEVRSSVPKDHAVEAEGLRWHVVEEGEGPVVLLVHGTAASVHSWRKVIPYLSDHFHVVAVDLPATGRRSRGGPAISRCPAWRPAWPAS